MTNLSKLLQKYYIRDGARILFKNKYSLNQLSLELWEKLNYAGIDQSSLSRVINGKRLFTKEQLEAFCVILQVNSSEKATLFMALEHDYLNRHGLKLNHNQNSIDVAETLNQNYKMLHYAGERGDVNFITDWASEISNFIKSFLRKPSISTSVKSKMSYLLGLVIYEKGYINNSVLTPKQNYISSKPIILNLLRLSKELNSIELFLRAQVIFGFLYYSQGYYSFSNRVRKYYLKSIDETIKALKSSENYEEFQELTLIFWRYIALNSIYTRNKNLFEIAENKTVDIVKRNYSNSNVSYIVWALDTLARGQSHFGKSKALDTLAQRERFEKKIHWEDPIREASMIRNEIEVYRNLKLNKPNRLLWLLERGLNIAQKSNISRYSNLFKRYSLEM